MATGARARLGVEVAVAVTGSPGPDGGTAEKPVGLVYVHAETPEASRGTSSTLPGDRDSIRAASGGRCAPPGAATVWHRVADTIAYDAALLASETVNAFGSSAPSRSPTRRVDALVAWQRDALRCDARAPGRRAPPHHAAFLGHRSASELERIAEALRDAVRAAWSCLCSGRCATGRRGASACSSSQTSRAGRGARGWSTGSGSSRSASTSGSDVPGFRTSRCCASAGDRGCARRFRSSGRSVRPKRLSTIPSRGPAGRSTKFSNLFALGG